MSRPSANHPERGQAVVEFSLAVMVFLVMLIGIFDLGRGIYTYNGVSEAAREVARVTSVHVGNPVGTSAQTLDRVAVQNKLTPDMGTPVFTCVDLYGSSSSCTSGNYVKVVVTASYRPSVLLGMLDPMTFLSSSSIQIP
jgi:Flp pilus assembly protein TadG